MNITLWGTRGSLASPGANTVRYGGDTSCVEVRGTNGEVLILDAGTGVRRLGPTVLAAPRVDLLLTHLHMDHIQGLGFFAPLFTPGMEVHIWGPVSPAARLRERLGRYLSPPLFPVHLRDLTCNLTLHDVTPGEFEIGPFNIAADLVCHPDATLGYRVREGDAVLAYLPDHEPALGVRRFPESSRWTSGFDLVAGAGLVIHDAQYTAEQYSARVGWGHSTLEHALALATMAEIGHLVTFHHDPSNSDEMLDAIATELRVTRRLPFDLTPGIEGASFELKA